MAIAANWEISTARSPTTWQPNILQVVRSTISGRESLARELSGLACDVVPSQANFVLADVHRDAAELFERLLRRGVIVRPAGGWGYPTHLRVTVGTPAQNARFLEALREESPA